MSLSKKAVEPRDDPPDVVRLNKCRIHICCIGKDSAGRHDRFDLGMPFSEFGGDRVTVDFAAQKNVG